MDADDDLLSALRARVADPATRRGSRALSTPALYPPVTIETIALTETELGFSLPPFLQRLYTEVANGGFGPGYGLVGLTGGHGDSEGESLVARYHDFRTGGWPENLLPLWDWGCAIWSCLDAHSSEGTIVTHDGADGPTVTDFTIRSWLRAWVDGVDLWNDIYEDTGEEMISINPFTRKPTVVKAPGRAKGKKN